MGQPRYLFVFSVCLTANLSVKVSPPIDRPCLISTTIRATHTSPPRHVTSPHLPESLYEYLSSNFTAYYFFFHICRGIDPWLSFIPLIHRVAEANLQGTRQRLFVKLLFISFIKSSSSPIKEPRTVALDSHITLVSFGEMIYCLI